jgi:hypothetical protein
MNLRHLSADAQKANAAAGSAFLPVAGVLSVILHVLIGDRFERLQLVIFFIPAAIAMFYVRYRVLRWLENQEATHGRD